MKKFLRYLRNLVVVLSLVAVVSFGMAVAKYLIIFTPEGTGSIVYAVAFIGGILFLAAIWDN